MEKLVELPDVSKLSSNVVRILGQNPGKFTLQGTNTYLIGKSAPYILIDTAEGNDAYANLLKDYLGNLDDEDSDVASMVSDIVITHEHADHFGGLPSVLDILKSLAVEHPRTDRRYEGPKIHKFPTKPSCPSIGKGNDSDSDSDSKKAYDHSERYNSVLASIPLDAFTPNPSGGMVHDLSDGQVLETADGSSRLRIVHTAGHTADSICILLNSNESSENENAGKAILFTADSVLGQGTAVFEDLWTYITSLQRLVSSDFPPFQMAFPGHGPVIEDGPTVIGKYIEHRIERENQIIAVLRQLHGEGFEQEDVSIWDVVKEIYKHYPENLWIPAAKGVGLHLRKLEIDGRAKCLGGKGIEQKWRFVS